SPGPGSGASRLTISNGPPAVATSATRMLMTAPPLNLDAAAAAGRRDSGNDTTQLVDGRTVRNFATRRSPGTTNGRACGGRKRDGLGWEAAPGGEWGERGDPAAEAYRGVPVPPGRNGVGPRARVDHAQPAVPRDDERHRRDRYPDRAGPAADPGHPGHDVS